MLVYNNAYEETGSEILARGMHMHIAMTTGLSGAHTVRVGVLAPAHPIM